MKFACLTAALLAAGLLARGVSAAPAITGDYVESRSANVYVGACHHESEIQTAGRNAVLAWNITAGAFRGVSLAGVTAVAVVAGDRHLSFADAKRRSVLYVSDRATPEQREALVALFRERAAGALGEIVAVKSAPVRFDARGEFYRVEVPGAASMTIRKQTQELCCKQPYELWDRPFLPVEAARAGYCVGVEYRDAGLLQAWSATDQNNAYFGRFSL